MGGPWNVNIHYDARLAGCVPASANAVLDAGCGDGFLAARLAGCVPRVVAIDIDAPVLGRARARFPDVPVAWCRADVLACPLVPGSFDAVLSNAMFHHLPDARAGLRRLSELVRPGGTLAIVGFPRAEWRDLPWAVATTILRGVAIRVRRKWPHTAPTVWPPRDSIRQLRRAAREVLPGSRVRLLPLGRYLLTWSRPPGLARGVTVWGFPDQDGGALGGVVGDGQVRHVIHRAG
jgi:2-polyprenyl-3-methyl-5-hydroxy-6-metoxy-1,4-benzoquinol methylase